MELGQRVRDLRDARRLSQAGLAQRAGIARNTLNRIENGHLMPTAPVIERLAVALGVEPGDLFASPKAQAPPPDAERAAQAELSAWDRIEALIEGEEQVFDDSGQAVAFVHDLLSGPSSGMLEGKSLSAEIPGRDGLSRIRLEDAEPPATPRTSKPSPKVRVGAKKKRRRRREPGEAAKGAWDRP